MNSITNNSSARTLLDFDLHRTDEGSSIILSRYLPSGIFVIFHDKLAEVSEVLNNSYVRLARFFVESFFSSESGSSAIQSKSGRTFRASSLLKNMDGFDALIENAPNKLLHFISTLASALNMEEKLENGDIAVTPSSWT